MNNKTPITGRTPWDFLSELVRVLYRIGPSTIVVGGFLILIIFLYREVNEARISADAQLQDRLSTAQQQLVETYQKIGSMSNQMIENTRDLLELNSEIDQQIEERRRELQKSNTLAIEAKEEAEAAKTVAATAKQEATLAEQKTQRQREQSFDLDERRKELQVEIENLKREKDDREKELAEHANQIAAHKEEIRKLREQLQVARAQPSDMQGIDQGRDKQSEHQQLIREILEKFISTPTNDSIFHGLFGIEMETFKKAIQEDTEFELWIEVSEGDFFGFLKSEEYGYNYFLGVYSFGEGTIATVDSFAGMVLLHMPRAENWYKNWTVWTVVEEEDVSARYESEVASRWDLYQALEVWEMDLDLISGRIASFGVISLTEFESLFPRAFKSWSNTVDQFGRPKLILRMLERERSYGVASTSWADDDRVPDELRKVFKDILVSSVKREYDKLASYSGQRIDKEDHGVLAAIALRDEPRIVDVIGDRLDDGANQDVQQFKMMISVAAPEQQSTTGEEQRVENLYELVFERGGSQLTWKLVQLVRGSI